MPRRKESKSKLRLLPGATERLALPRASAKGGSLFLIQLPQLEAGKWSSGKRPVLQRVALGFEGLFWSR